MPRGKRRQDTDILAMALVGYEQEKEKIDQKIREIRALIGGTATAAAPARVSAATSAPAATAPATRRKRKPLSAEARKRIAAAQKKRWAEHRKQQGKE